MSLLIKTIRPVGMGMTGPAEANFHWTGNSLIFIFIACDHAPLHFVQCFGCVRRESLSTKQVYTDS